VKRWKCISAMPPLRWISSALKHIEAIPSATLVSFDPRLER